jgi:hypothetical protein
MEAIMDMIGVVIPMVGCILGLARRIYKTIQEIDDLVK